MLRNLVALAVITAVTAGCDNVKWVGLDVHLTPPRPKDELVTEFPGLAAALATEEEPCPRSRTGRSCSRALGAAQRRL